MSGNWEKAYSRGSGGRRREKEAPVVVRSVEVSFHVKLREYTTIGIGGAADRMAVPRSPAPVRGGGLGGGARGVRVGYREGEYPVRGIVVRAGFRFVPGTRETVFEQMRQMNERRRSRQ